MKKFLLFILALSLVVYSCKKENTGLPKQNVIKVDSSIVNVPQKVKPSTKKKRCRRILKLLHNKH